MTRAPRPSIYYGTALVASLLPALLSAYLALGQVRTTDYVSGGASTLNAAQLIANDFQASFDRVDALLKSIGRQYVDGLAAGPEERSRLARHLDEEIADYPFVARVFVADANGRIAVGSGAFNVGPTGADVSDRPYFKRALAGEPGTDVRGPAQGEVRRRMGDRSLAAARDRNGRFPRRRGRRIAGTPSRPACRAFNSPDTASLS